MTVDPPRGLEIPGVAGLTGTSGGSRNPGTRRVGGRVVDFYLGLRRPSKVSGAGGSVLNLTWKPRMIQRTVHLS